MSEPQVMLITGTSKGIGRYLAEYYCRRGFLVEGCSRGNPDWKADNYHHHIVDVADEDQVTKMLNQIWKKHRRLNVVINNAAVASMNHFLLTPVQTVDTIFRINFRGTFLICRESAKLMKQSNYGRIINISSVAVPMLLEGEAIYAASKSAVETFTKIIAKELANFGITCNAIGPAPIKTDLIRRVPEEKIQHLIENLPVKEIGNLHDVANAIDFLIRPESQNITGQVIYLGGVS